MNENDIIQVKQIHQSSFSDFDSDINYWIRENNIKVIDIKFVGAYGGITVFVIYEKPSTTI